MKHLTAHMKMNRLHNKEGIVMATVIILTMVMAVVALGLMGLNISQQTTGQSVIDTVKAEQLSEGAFFYYHQLQLEGCPSPPCETEGDCTNCTPADLTLNGKKFSITTQEPGTTGPNGVSSVQVTIDY